MRVSTHTSAALDGPVHDSGDGDDSQTIDQTWNDERGDGGTIEDGVLYALRVSTIIEDVLITIIDGPSLP